MKRLFFGMEVHAPWPSTWPSGRLIDTGHRHITLAFLGDVSYGPLARELPFFPKPPFLVGPAGFFDACLMLPPAHPRVAAWHVANFDSGERMRNYQTNICSWLRSQGILLEEREWLPHVSLCRQPADFSAWKREFTPLPFYSTAIHLYESLGNLIYQPLWSLQLIKPFEEIEHTADLAFMIEGKNMEQLYCHAFCALAFKHPALLNYYQTKKPSSLDEIILFLNEIITVADIEGGCGLKAVCYHGKIIKSQNHTLQWEMIIDV
jgi:2'-5' RNA ligase